MKFVLSALLLVLMAAMTATVTWQIVSRFVLNDPSSITEELARFQLIWVGFGGAAYAFLMRMHVGIDLLTSHLGSAARRTVGSVIWTVCAVFSGIVMVYGGARLVQVTAELGQTSPALGWPVAGVYVIIPVCGLIILTAALTFLTRTVRGEDLLAQDGVIS